MSMPAIESQLPSSGAIAVDIQGRALPLRRAHLTAHAGAGHARVVLEQTFVNGHAEPLDITYTLPLPADAAVAGYRFALDGAEVIGRVETRSDARAAFETALLEGRSAALLEEERSSVFTQRLGNVPPGQTLTVRIELDQPLAWEDGHWAWRFPTVVGPRYLGAMPAAEARGVVVEIATTPPDAALGVSLHIADTCTGPVTSPSHPIERHADRVTLTGAHALDRDVVVRWPVAQPTPSVSAQVGRHDGDTYAAITVVPPAEVVEAISRHLVVLLDTSGSMGGSPLRQAKELTAALIATLGPRDHLELLAFSSQVERFRDAPLAMDLDARRQALSWLNARAAGGGTEMTTGIRAAVGGRGIDGAQKQIVLVTDGYIGFESEIIAIALDERDHATRIHTVGVGSSINRSLTEPVARAGGGQELILGIDEPVGPATARLVAHTQLPVVVDLELVGDAVLTTTHRLPDLYAGAPVTLYAKVDPEAGPLTVRGRTAAGAWSVDVPAVPTDGSAAPLRWARDQVADLELLCAAERRRPERERRIEAIGLAFQISTRFTSWVAETRHATVDPDGPSLAETQPQALPFGVSAQGVGLRSTSAQQAEGDTNFFHRPFMQQSVSWGAQVKEEAASAGAAPTGGLRKRAPQAKASPARTRSARAAPPPAPPERIQAAPTSAPMVPPHAPPSYGPALPETTPRPHHGPLRRVLLLLALLVLTGALALAAWLLWLLFA